MTRKVGRPRKAIPADAAEQIEKFAALGASVVGIAKALNVGKDTLREWMDGNPALQEAFDRGRERERLTLHNSLFRAATEKHNVIAAIFLLKARHAYRDAGDDNDGGNRPQVVVNIAAPASLKDYKPPVITVEKKSNP